MEQLLCLILRFTGQVYAQLLEHVFIYGRKYHGRMHFTAAQLFQLPQGKVCLRVCRGADAERNQHFVRMQTGIMVPQMPDFQFL